MPTPYAQYVGSRDPLAVMRETIGQTQSVLNAFTPGAWARSYAPGKWTAQQLIVHVAQAELVFGMRARYALFEPNYVVQPFDQDPWVASEGAVVDGPTALEAFAAFRRMNIALFSSLTPAQRARTFTHPERGAMTVEDVLVSLAGHEAHHLQHFKQIAAQAR